MSQILVGGAVDLGLAEKTDTLRIAVIGSDYITNLGLSQLLGSSPLLDLRGTFPDGAAALPMIVADGVDMVLIDAAMQPGPLLKICREFGKLPTSPTIVVMGDVPFAVTESLVFEGVSAIVNHAIIAGSLPAALQLIHLGGAVVVSTDARVTLMNRGITFDSKNRMRFDTLNPREKSVAQGVAEGMTNAQLATAMHMSEATVKLLVSNVMNKLGATNRVQIAVVVTKAQLI